MREVRFTGGEPLLRRGLTDIIRRTTALAPRPETSITTNALGLDSDRHARSRRPDSTGSTSASTPSALRTSAAITRRDRLDDVIAGSGGGEGRRARSGQGQRRPAARHQRRPGPGAAALVHGARLPAAVHRADAAGRPAQWSRDAHGHRGGDLRLAGRRVPADPVAEPRGSAPAELFAVDGGPHTVGVIASVTRPFCGDCDRVRLTADGQVRNCLFAREESDLRAALRGGADDDEIADRWRPPCSASVPGTASTTCRSCSRRARCRPSAADRRTPPFCGPCETPATIPGEVDSGGNLACQNVRMRLFAAIVPPREVLEEVEACRAVGEPAAHQRREARRRSCRFVATAARTRQVGPGEGRIPSR